MVAESKTITVPPAGEIAKILDQASSGPLFLVSGRKRYRVTPEPDDIWADYDPDAVRAAFEGVRGLLAGVDIEALKAELRAQRDQDSAGRPA